MVNLKVYVQHNETKEGVPYIRYTAHLRKNDEWVNLVFAKDLKKPEVNSIISIDNNKIFLSKDSNSKRKTYVILEIKDMIALEDTLIEDDFFY